MIKLKNIKKSDSFISCDAFIESCQEPVCTIPLLCYDAHAAEDLDTALEDHVADETRYFCMSRPVRALRTAEEKARPFDPLRSNKEEMNGR